MVPARSLCLLSNLGLGLQLRHRLSYLLQPSFPKGQLLWQFVSTLIRTVTPVLIGTPQQLINLRRQLRFLLFHPSVAHGFVPRCVRPHLRAVQRHVTQLHHHPRMIQRPASTLPLVEGRDLRRVQLVHDVGDEVRQMVVQQPLLQCRRQQQLLNCTYCTHDPLTHSVSRTDC